MRMVADPFQMGMFAAALSRPLQSTPAASSSQAGTKYHVMSPERSMYIGAGTGCANFELAVAIPVAAVVPIAPELDHRIVATFDKLTEFMKNTYSECQHTSEYISTVGTQYDRRQSWYDDEYQEYGEEEYDEVEGNNDNIFQHQDARVVGDTPLL